MPLFPLRPSVYDLAAGQARRLVRSESDLLVAVADTRVRQIVIADSFKLSKKIILPSTRPGLEIVGTYGSELFLPDAADGFQMEGNRQSLRGIFASASHGSSGFIFVRIQGVSDCVVEGCAVSGLTLVEGEGDGRSLVANNVVTGSVTSGIVLEGRASVLSNSFEVTSSIEVTGSYGRVIGNYVRSSIILSGSGSVRSAVVGNALHGGTGTITSSASGGNNVIMGNTGVQTITAHATDIYQTITDGDPLNSP